MNNLIIKIVAIILFCGMAINSFAQSGKLIKADKNFSDFKYKEAIALYIEIAKAGYQTSSKEHVCSKLGDAYRLTNDPKNAENWYKLATETDVKDAKTYYYYSEVLRCNKKYDEASIWLDKYLQNNPTDKAALKELAGFKDFYKLLSDSNKISVKFMDGINSTMSDYSPSYYKNKVIFVSALDSISVRRSSWTDEPFYSLYECQIDSNNNLSSYKRLFGEVNSKYHEGPVSFDKTTGVLYFTRNNYFKGKKGLSKDNTNYLKIYQATNKDGKWIDIKELPFNNNEYSCAHPAISTDDKRLYFISNMPGGLGGTDLYYVERQDSGWSQPKNVGEPLNTAGNELFPSFSDNGILYFASNGHPGLGGLDIFSYSKGKINNMGYPINTSYDDFGITTQNGDKGYFTSNRKGGVNSDDIYFFQLSQPIIRGKLITGTAMELDSSILANVSVNLYDDQKNKIDSITTTEDGKYEFKAEPDKNYSLDGNKQKYNEGKNIANTFIDDYIVVADLFLKKIPQLSLYCLITDEKTGKPIDSVKITMQDNFSKKVELITTSTSGDFYKNMEDRKLNDSISYKITTEKKGYLTKIQTYRQRLYREGLYNMHEILNFKMDPVEEGVDLSKIVDVKAIYFDLGKDKIRPDAAKELDKIVKVMNENPNLVIELGAHTDCRGNAKANMDLSERRAKSSANYIKSRITNPERIYGKGYGETKPINHCECEGTKVVPCTEEEHQQNRRTEFKVIKY